MNRRLLIVVPLGLAILLFTGGFPGVRSFLGFGGGPSDKSSQIAGLIGAEACSAEQYEIISKLDHTKTQIYDCVTNGKEMCVTYQNGIASDDTVEVKLLFSNTLGDSRPVCIGTG